MIVHFNRLALMIRIVVRVTGADKKWTWQNATNSLTTTENIDVTTGNEYKVAGTSVPTRIR